MKLKYDEEPDYLYLKKIFVIHLWMTNKSNPKRKPRKQRSARLETLMEQEEQKEATLKRIQLIKPG